MMAKTNTEKHYINRLEDAIRIANEGKRVDMEVSLKTQQMIQEVNAKEADKTPHDIPHNINSYLLIANYTFKIDLQSYKCTKAYMFGALEESLTTKKINKDVANARLEMDYKRLRDAHIHFQEKFF